MPPAFAARSLTLRQLFGDGYNLRVPDYQRAYSWTTAEAGQLIDDLQLAIEDAAGPNVTGEDDYFLGAIVLMEAAVASAETGLAASVAPRQEIVDGLQRIVTLTILFAVLRDLLADVKPDTAGLAATCVGASGAAAGGAHRGPRLELDGDAQTFFRDFVQDANATSAMPDDDDLGEGLMRILAVREHLMAVLVAESPARLESLVTFLLDHCHCAVISTRTLDRAHRIFSVLNDRGRPLARGDILKAQILGAIALPRRREFSEVWNGLERRHGGSLEELLSHIRTIEGRSRQRIIDDIRILIGRSGSAEAFIETMLLPYGAIIEQIREQGRDLDDSGIARHLGYLCWLGSADWMPPLMLQWRLCNGAPEVLAPFAARLERLAYGMRLLGIGTDKRVRRYSLLLDQIRSGRLDKAGGPLDITRDEQRLIAYNLRNLHARSQLACKLVLLRLNDELAGKPQHLDPADYTVEHLLPQKPARTSEWRQWFPDAEEREQCTQSLGNLILVSRDRNERARNLELGHKLEIYFGDGAEQPRITRDIAGLTAWRPDDVRRREERLAGLLADVWQIGVSRAGDKADSEFVAPVGQPRPRASGRPREI